MIRSGSPIAEQLQNILKIGNSGAMITKLKGAIVFCMGRPILSQLEIVL
jgi:hypothetical protein